MTVSEGTVERDQRGRLSAVEYEDGRRTEVVRDDRGRITGVRGGRDPLLSKAVEALVELQERVDGIEGVETLDVAPIADALLALAERTATRDDIEAATGRLHAALAASERLKRDDLNDALDGWRSAPGGLEINARRIAQAAGRLRLAWPVTVRWMGPDEEANRDREFGGRTHGYRAAACAPKHTVVLRVGESASRTSKTIAHELGHCAQVEKLLSDFDEAYLRDPKRLELEADELATTVADVAMVRRATVPGAFAEAAGEVA